MDLFKRLSDYDVFAYLPQGFMALAAVDYLFGSQFILNAGWDVPKGFLTIFAAYVVGHLIASPSARIIERWLVGCLMKEPAIHLLSDQHAPLILRIIFAEYYTPFENILRKKILEKLGVEDQESIRGETLFWMAYPSAKRDEHAKDRMSTFLNLYGFCRNVCFVSALTSFVIFMQLGWEKWINAIPVSDEKTVVAIVLVVTSFMMFQRYLKFYRHYSIEVFTTFEKVTKSLSTNG